jgi:large subunit ribosomal protein L40
MRNASGRRDNVDPKRDIIRRALYPSNIRNKASPTGSWRPDTMRALNKTIPSVEAHETIERAFKLYIRHQRQRRQAELERKYQCMRNAMVELEKLDPHLALEANKPEDPRVRTEAEVALLNTLRGAEKKALEGRIRGLFPRELRAPTDTPSKDGWNYDWKPPSVRST